MWRAMFGLAVALLITALHSATAQDGTVVMIDAGHGGGDAGVQHEGINEKDYALRASFAFAEEFAIRGYDVVLTRTGDTAIGYDERRAIAEEAHAALFVSLHINGSRDDPSRHGTVIFVNEGDAKVAAIASAVKTALEEAGGSVVIEGRPWEFLASPTVPTIMIEMGYMTHPVERRLVLSSSYHHQMAATIADAVEEHLAR